MTVSTVARVFCPHCETETDADHCATDISTGIPFKSYVCHGCDGDITTTELEDEITAAAYVDLCAINPQAALSWRITRDGTYVPTVAAAGAPACSCGGRGICTVCVLAAFDADDGTTLLFCHRCSRYSVFSRRGRGFCPHCGSGDTGVTHRGHDSCPSRPELLADLRKAVA